MEETKTGQPTSITYKPTALVAGGAGFIGSFLCETLLLQGCRVLAVDNFLTGKEENLKNCLGNPDFRFQKHDLVQPLKETEKVDYVFHLAGMEGDKKASLKNLLVNSEGTKNLLEFARESGAKFLLGSSLEIFSAEVITKSLKTFFRKGDYPASHYQAKRFAEELVLQYFNQGVDVRIARLGWIYGPRMNLKSDREVAAVFQTALESDFIQVPGNGDQEIYPVFISDAVYGLTKAMFATQTNGEIFTLIGSEKISFLDLAQKIKRLSGKSSEIKFVPEKEEEIKIDDSVELGRKTLGWKAKIDLEEGIKKTLTFFSVAPVIGEEQERIKIETPGKKSVSNLWFKIGAGFIGLLFLIFLTLLPFYPFLFHSSLAAFKFKKAYRNFRQGEIEAFQKSIQAASLNFQKAGQELDNLEELFSFLKMETQKQRFGKTIKLAEKLARIGIYSSELAEKGEKISGIIFKDDSGNLQQLAGESRVLLETLARELSFLEVDLESNSELYSRFIFWERLLSVSDLKEKLPEIKKMAYQLSSFLTILPETAGVEGRKTYLVLFQNNMELRPTGGFIGSFGLAGFDQGRLVEFEVIDVYNADGQLKGHVEPPEPIKEYLGEAGWYLRDSNWDPNFPTSALRAEWFLEKTMARQVDGVVAANLNSAQKLLAAVGGVEVPDFNETVTAENLFEKAQSYSETGFFPGSTQKKDFLGSLARALLDKIKTGSLEERSKIAQSIYQALEEKEILVFLDDPNLIETVNSLGWEGSIRKLNCPIAGSPCLKDYLMIVEANLGVNKANYYLKRSIVSQVKIDQSGNLEQVLKIDYLNGSSAGSRFGGDYKNYLRLYVPLGSALNWVKINNRILTEDEIDLEIAAGKTSFGFLAEIPAEEEKAVEVSYQPPFKIKKGVETDYLFFFQKQSGADSSRVNYILSLPSGASVLKTIPVPAKIGSGVQFDQNLTKDLLFQTRIKL